MQKPHAGPSELVMAMLRCSTYLHVRKKMKDKPMFDLTKTEPVVVDILQIEAEARRMRAEIIAQGLSAFGQKIARLLTSTFGATARS
jgi:hypothetical protein